MFYLFGSTEMRKTRPTILPCVSFDHGDVECDICSRRKLKAVKSCLDCLLSYCEIHLKAHNELNPRRSHTVINATDQLHERICSLHNRALEVFCRTDQTCICYLCLMDQHKGHDIITATEEWSNRKGGLGEIQTRWQLTIQRREKVVQELRRAVETLKSSAQSAVEHSDQMFDDIISSVERRRSEVTELIRAQETAEVSPAEGLLERLEQEISELKKRVAEMEQLSRTQDPIHFLKNVGSIPDIPDSTIPTSLNVNSNLSFEPVKVSVSALKTQLEEKLDSIFEQEADKISAAGGGGRILILCRILILWLFLFCSLLAVGVLAYQRMPKASPYDSSTPSSAVLVREATVSTFSDHMRALQQHFPAQRKELWRRTQIHLQRHLGAAQPSEPVSFILAGGREAEITLGCLARRLASAFSTALNTSMLELEGSRMAGGDSDQVKLELDTKLTEAFEGDKSAAVIHRLEELPPSSSLIFYHYCDHENAAYKHPLLAFTVLLPLDTVGPEVSLPQVEELVHSHIHQKFLIPDQPDAFDRMDVDKLSGLWSRISQIILPVNAEEHVEKGGCGRD